jgi:pseudouridine-5'-phosphate glycosidase
MVISFPVVPLEGWNPRIAELPAIGHRYERLPCGFARRSKGPELADSLANAARIAGFARQIQTQFIVKKGKPGAKSA